MKVAHQNTGMRRKKAFQDLPGNKTSPYQSQVADFTRNKTLPLLLPLNYKCKHSTRLKTADFLVRRAFDWRYQFPVKRQLIIKHGVCFSVPEALQWTQAGNHGLSGRFAPLIVCRNREHTTNISEIPLLGRAFSGYPLLPYVSCEKIQANTTGTYSAGECKTDKIIMYFTSWGNLLYSITWEGW